MLSVMRSEMYCVIGAGYALDPTAMDSAVAG